MKNECEQLTCGGNATREIKYYHPSGDLYTVRFCEDCFNGWITFANSMGYKYEVVK